MEGRMERMEGWKDGRMEGRKDGRMEGWKIDPRIRSKMRGGGSLEWGKTYGDDYGELGT